MAEDGVRDLNWYVEADDYQEERQNLVVLELYSHNADNEFSTHIALIDTRAEIYTHLLEYYKKTEKCYSNGTTGERNVYRGRECKNVRENCTGLSAGNVSLWWSF